MRLVWLKLAGLVVLGCLFSQAAAADDKAGKDAALPAAGADKKEAAADKSEAAVEKKEGAAEQKEAPEFIVFDKAKLGTVKFAHKAHAEATGGCAACHEGKEPLFKQERSKEVRKMAEMNAGKSCGACHDGKKPNKDGKPVFSTKGGCMKCHKKEK